MQPINRQALSLAIGDREGGAEGRNRRRQLVGGG
jgi:hypothetical protein